LDAAKRDRSEPSSRLQAPGTLHFLATAVVPVGRRSVPPAERPSTGVGV